MNHLYLLCSDEHALLRQGFTEWLSVLGYAPSSVVSLPTAPGGVPPGTRRPAVKYGSDSNLRPAMLTAFIEHLQTRDRCANRQGFSAGHINKYIQALQLFSHYIRQSRQKWCRLYA